MYRQCPKCGQAVADVSEQTCIGCGLIFAKYKPPQPKVVAPASSAAKGLGAKLKTTIVLAAVAAVSWWYGRVVVLPSNETEPARKLQESVDTSLIRQATRQYELVVANGTKIERCVHAGLVANAYLHAMQEDGYKAWSAVKKRDCEAAGLPE